ncbi:MAG TPA: AAA family ATPase [Ktedonobacteraceae bacterium]|nr:AAA family ATPase [Ktedonobacteraceae bacterium]
MIVFINGAFGAGKTTVAELLNQRIPNSLLYDPEVVGMGLRYILQPITTFNDFQDLPPWRPLVVETARHLLKTYGRTLIVPMTLWNKAYFLEITDGLRTFEPHLFHFCLTATEATLRKRLQERPSSPQAYAWACERIERCVTAFEDEMFAVQLSTDTRTPEELVVEILSQVPINSSVER